MAKPYYYAVLSQFIELNNEAVKILRNFCGRIDDLANSYKHVRNDFLKNIETISLPTTATFNEGENFYNELWCICRYKHAFYESDKEFIQLEEVMKKIDSLKEELKQLLICNYIAKTVRDAIKKIKKGNILYEPIDEVPIPDPYRFYFDVPVLGPWCSYNYLLNAIRWLSYIKEHDQRFFECVTNSELSIDYSTAETSKWDWKIYEVNEELNAKAKKFYEFWKVNELTLDNINIWLSNDSA